MSAQSITLEQLLFSRDQRRENQLRILSEHPGTTLIVATVVIPGSVKRSDDSLVIADAACRAIEAEMQDLVRPVLKRDLITGFEAFYVTSLPPQQAKELAAGIEDTHPLGRMMDIDVLDSGGNQVSRASRGERPRRCLLCDRDARICMRAFTHTQQELLAEIHRRVVLWQKSQGFI